MNTAFASVIFPSNLNYLEDFLSSLEAQTYSDFHLLLFNDQCERTTLAKILISFNLEYSILDVEPKSPAEIRLQMLDHLRASDWDIIIFGDTDDTFSANRIQESISALADQGTQIVFNDLSITDDKGVVLEECIWKLRAEKINVNLEFLLDQNVLGLGNTAIKRNVLPASLKISSGVLAFDWIFYLQLFYHNQSIRCTFIPDAHTLYRQHGANTLGLKKDYSELRVQNLYDIKLQVMGFARDIGISGAAERYEALLRYQEEILQNKARLDLLIDRLNKNKEPYFWFEEINSTNEKD